MEARTTGLLLPGICLHNLPYTISATLVALDYEKVVLTRPGQVLALIWLWAHRLQIGPPILQHPGRISGSCLPMGDSQPHLTPWLATSLSFNM